MRAGTVLPGEKKAQENLINVYKHTMGGRKAVGPRLFSVVPANRTRENGQKLKHRKLHLNIGGH